MKRILYTIIFLWVAVTYTHAQQHCFFTHYSTEDGLSQNTVMSILQDHKDNLWFATWDGINRFDGYTFKVYKARQGNYISLANNRVDRLYEDCNGFLWLMTYDNRVHRFDPRTETFEQVPKAGDKGSYLNIHRVEVLANGTVWLFTENDGAIRVTISEQGSRFSCDIYSAESGLFPALYVNRVYLDKAGNEWLLTDNGLGMIPAGEKRAISYFVDTSEKAKGLKQAFYAVMETETDLCFGSDRGRIWCYKKKDGEFSLLEIPTKARVTSIHMATSTQAIVTTDKDGFFSHNLKTKANIHYSPITCKELPDKPILSAYVDRHKEVWFEQEEPGVVAHFNPATGIVKCERVKTEYSSAERSRPAFHIHEDVNGYLWVHPFGGGFSYFDREKIVLFLFIMN